MPLSSFLYLMLFWDSDYRYAIYRQIDHLDFLVHSFCVSEDHPPATLEEIWSRYEDGQAAAKASLTDSRGNKFQYSTKSNHGQDKPDIWIVDRTTGKTYGN